MNRALLLWLLVGLGCGDTLPQATEQDSWPVLGHIHTRHERLTIHSTPAGPRFTVRDASGRIISRDLTRSALRQRHPVLHQHYEQAHVLDASLYQPLEGARPYR
ncbi:MAG: hypothetical protein RMK29_12990 [Myxococcales bacterium]|nr:hypothetical protein [Myxococcota bacterium]MDW8282621.1 hypothetical protein [Myxococcales bacterium]